MFPEEIAERQLAQSIFSFELQMLHLAIGTHTTTSGEPTRTRARLTEVETHPKVQLVAGRLLHLQKHLQDLRFACDGSDLHGIDQRVLGPHLPGKSPPPVDT